MNHPRKIGFAGLSHLGIIYSAAAAARGFDVVAFDDRAGLAEALMSRRFPVAEPGLDQLAQEHASRLHYTSNASDLQSCTVVFLTLDVSTNDANRSDLGPMQGLLERVIPRLSPGTSLVIQSQIPPGFCREFAKKLPGGIRLFYQVETLVFGNAVERAVHPERFMAGCDDPRAELPAAYSAFLNAFECPVLRMRYESAELCKIAINCFLVSSVATSNTLAEICEKTGAHWQEIVPALRLDRRIGPYAYLSPGLGIAGGNLERDLVTIQRLAAENGCDASVVTAWQRNSAYRRDWALRRLFESGALEDKSERIGVWGLAYKQDTHSIKNSPSLALLRTLSRHRFAAYDPAAKIDGAEFPNVQVCGSAVEVVRDAAALVVMTPWREFAEADLARVLPAMRGKRVLDPYGILDGERCQSLGFSYEKMGA